MTTKKPYAPPSVRSRPVPTLDACVLWVEEKNSYELQWRGHVLTGSGKAATAIMTALNNAQADQCKLRCLQSFADGVMAGVASLKDENL